MQRWLPLLGLCAIGACTRSEPAPSENAGGGSGAGGGSASGGDMSSASGASSGGTGTGGGGAPSSEPEACRWEGWYRAPRMPAGCTGLCIPDDVAQRVPTLRWMDKPEWCAGCQHLETPWATTDAQKQNAVGLAVDGHGLGPSFFGIAIVPPEGGIIGVYDGLGRPLAAWKVDTDQPTPCGRLWGVPFDLGGSLATWLVSSLSEPYSFLHVPLSRASELMTSTESTFIWSSEFTRGRGINDLWFNEAMVAADFSGSIGLGDFATGQAIEINETVTGLPGFYNEAQLAGSTAFVSRYTGYRTDWFVVEDGRARPFLGDEQADVDFLVSDGETIVFKQGVEPYQNPAGANPPILYRRYDLYRAAYTNDPGQVQPSLLLSNVSPGLYHARMLNGYVVAQYLTVTEPMRESAAIVVRLSDGRAWRSILPDGYSWGRILYPSATQLWGAVTRRLGASEYETIARVPYDTMELLQSGPPG